MSAKRTSELLESMSASDPGCVKTPTRKLRVEFPSRFRRCKNQLHWPLLSEVANEKTILGIFGSCAFLHKLGQKRKCPGPRGTSVLPSGADNASLPRHVRLVPMHNSGLLHRSNQHRIRSPPRRTRAALPALRGAQHLRRIDPSASSTAAPEVGTAPGVRYPARGGDPLL